MKHTYDVIQRRNGNGLSVLLSSFDLETHTVSSKQPTYLVAIIYCCYSLTVDNITIPPGHQGNRKKARRSTFINVYAAATAAAALSSVIFIYDY